MMLFKHGHIRTIRSCSLRYLNSLVLIGVLMVLQACSASRKTGTVDEDQISYSVAQQKRINRYFHDTVVPDLGECWTKLTGDGTVGMTYTYEKDAKGAWRFKNVELEGSTLPTGVASTALGCMRKAASGTSFAADQSEKGNSYTLHWTWPVPFPPNASEDVEKMFLDNGGGAAIDCDGKGTAPRCVRCATNDRCKMVCVGFPSCTILTTPDWTTCAASDFCASGGPFGIIGGSRRIF
jgi:hypothetical protein